MNSNGGITTISEFVDRIQELAGDLLLYRGLAHSAWNLEASGYRRLKNQKNGSITTEDFQNDIVGLLESAGLRGYRRQYGKEYSDLELLAELQHNRAATCLIDFTANPFIALWFACIELDNENGKVCAMRTDEDFAEVTYKKVKNKSIMYFFEKDKWFIWYPEYQYNRIVSQSSVFVFGKPEIKERYYEIIEINKECKQKILEELENKYGIEEQYVFSDFSGFALSRSHDGHTLKRNYSAKHYFYKGLRSDRRGEYKDALEFYNKTLEIEPNSPSTYNNRGIVKVKLGDHKAAVTDFNKAIEINPRYAKAYYNRGLAKMQLGDHEDAVTDFNKAIEINSRYAKAYNKRGLVKVQLGDYNNAVKDFDKAIEINPLYADAYSNRGLVKVELGNYEDAVLDFDKAIEINPRYAKAYHNRGIVKVKLGDHKAAVTDFNKAIEINPRYAKAYYNRGLAKMQLGDHEDAVTDFNKAKEIDPNIENI